MYISPVPLLQTGWTPLHYAAKGGWLEVVRILVESGAPVKAECGVGYTPLQYAAKENHLTTLSFLLQQPDNNIVHLLKNRKVGLTFHTLLSQYTHDYEGTLCHWQFDY